MGQCPVQKLQNRAIIIGDMLFTLFLVILFIGSVGVLWHRISEKIPELVAIPDEVIVARLHEDSARVRIFLLHAKTFWREPRYREPFWRFCEKICYRAHIVLLRMDNGLMALAKKVRGYAGIANAEGNGSEESASEEKNAMAEEAVAAVLRAAAEPPRAASHRVQEVRHRKKEKENSASIA
ncbi:MAG: hypothetical protein WAP52_04275 [Candidatus Sungiibacteriota bacterium]